MRSVNPYRVVEVETSVSEANPHHLVTLLFEGLLQSLAVAKGAIAQADMQAKGRAISRIVRILEEGLKAGLDDRGGELTNNLRQLYDFCIMNVTLANLRNDVTKIDEVIRTIKPIAEGWVSIKNDPAVRTFH